MTVNTQWLAMPALQNGSLLARQSPHTTSGGQVRVEAALLREAQPGVWRLQPWLGRGEKQ